MSDPIPDEVLRRLLSACAPDGPLAPIPGLYNFTEITYLGEHVCDLADLARALLALREAARRIFDGMSGTWAEVDPPTLDALRALLPEEPK